MIILIYWSTNYFRFFFKQFSEFRFLSNIEDLIIILVSKFPRSIISLNKSNILSVALEIIINLLVSKSDLFNKPEIIRPY